MEEPTNILLYDYTEFREDLIKNGEPQKLEITSQVYERPIHRGNEITSGEDIYTWLFLAEIRNGNERHEAGHVYYAGQLSKEQIEKNVKEIKENPFKIMYEEFQEGYQI